MRRRAAAQTAVSMGPIRAPGYNIVGQQETRMSDLKALPRDWSRRITSWRAKVYLFAGPRQRASSRSSGPLLPVVLAQPRAGPARRHHGIRSRLNPIDQRGRPMHSSGRFTVDLSGPAGRPIHRCTTTPMRSSRLDRPAGRCRPACIRRCGTAAVPVWDSRTSFGDTDLLITNMERGKDMAPRDGQGQSAPARPRLCRVGQSQGRPGLNAIYFKINASPALKSDADRRRHHHLSEARSS